MDLATIIKETEHLGITILFCSIPTTKGRYDTTLGKPCIYVDKNLADTEKINIILHERSHHVRKDLENSLAYVPTYSHRIEAQAEKDRIIDFLNLVNTEYPIDKHFNCSEYMKHAHIPQRFESFVKELATRLYNENQKEKD